MLSFHGIVNRIWNYPYAIDIALLVVTASLNFLYLIVAVLVESCEGPASGSTCYAAQRSQFLAQLYQSNALILTLFSVILDFILGTLMFRAFLTVPKVVKALDTYRGYLFQEQYTKRLKIIYGCWASLLATLIILVLIENFVPGIYRTTHIALILNNLNQLINTCQFIAAFETMTIIEMLMSLATNRWLPSEDEKGTRSNYDGSDVDPIAAGESDEADSRQRVIAGLGNEEV
jgi:hypothetical protein